MSMTHAPFHLAIEDNEVKSWPALGALTLGVCLISALAQLSVPLPFTPVPVTGQTLGVALTSLLLGARLGFATVFSYLFVGLAGLPVFAGGAAGISVGPSAGYLVGMLLASSVMGRLSDCGWTRNFLQAYVACLAGSAVIFACGMAGLWFFYPEKNLLGIGMAPFLPGDLIKSVFAASTAAAVTKGLQK